MMNPTVVYLAQTDTTVGFLSQDSARLAYIKKRDVKKKFIISIDSFKTLKTFVRVPQKHKKMIRRASRLTVVYPNNQALRVVKDTRHLKFLKKIKWLYTTSANQTNSRFDAVFAKQNVDVVVYDGLEFFEKNPSTIIKCGKMVKRRLR